MQLLTLANLITDADENANADTNANAHANANIYSDYYARTKARWYFPLNCVHSP